MNKQKCTESLPEIPCANHVGDLRSDFGPHRSHRWPQFVVALSTAMSTRRSSWVCKNYIRLFSDERFLNSIRTSVILIFGSCLCPVGLGLRRRRRNEREPAVHGVSTSGLCRAYGAAVVRRRRLLANSLHAPAWRRQLLSQPDRRDRPELALQPHLHAGGCHHRRRMGMDAFRGAHVLDVHADLPGRRLRSGPH